MYSAAKILIIGAGAVGSFIGRGWRWPGTWSRWPAGRGWPKPCGPQD